MIAAVLIGGGLAALIDIVYALGWGCGVHWHFYALIFGMKSTIDAAGRIIVPKAMRDALGLKPGQPLEIRANDGRLEIEAASTPMKLRKKGKSMVAVPDEKLPPLTADQVRETLEQSRR